MFFETQCMIKVSDFRSEIGGTVGQLGFLLLNLHV